LAENPVLIHGGGHLEYLNTFGLKRAGLNITSEPGADRRDFASNLDENGNIDMAHILQENSGPSLQTWDEAGLTCKIHTVRSGAVRQTLNNFEASQKGNPKGPHHSIAHHISADPSGS
jgi:hypothetical protein